MFRIDRPTWILTAVGGVLLLALWAVLNRPFMVPEWPNSIQGVAFSPFQANQSPQTPTFPTEEQISRDLDLLADRIESVRTYSVESTLGSVPRLADNAGLDVLVGVWISDDQERNVAELKRLVELLPSFGDNINGIVVGNEALLRGEVNAAEMVEFLRIVKRLVGDIPVTVAETWDNWIKNPEIVEHVDYITAHVLPYWEGVPVDNAHDYVFQRYNDLRRAYPATPIVLGEVGWPSEGRQRGGAIPSLQNQAKFLRQFLDLAHTQGISYYALEAFDQVWKTDEGAVGRYWGIYNAAREPKFPFTAPVTPVPAWPALAGFSLAFAILIVALLFRDSRGLVHRGRGFLIMVSYAISTAVVWLIYDYSNKYLSWEQVLVGIGLLTAAFCITIVMLAEAHEWAETIWARSNPRAGPKRRLTATNNRKVSVHVPIYNEPPEMVIETLAALRELDYSNYEVVVVDNNTDDESVWRPVEEWCLANSDIFHFYHVAPLDGFKAGALNYAMQKTADDAELIAVIDSDYVVRPNWLADCVPMFEEAKVAIVQAPQDYRDANESLFKSMIYCEYAGFFGIGMINRDARNAIIQHGTMTIVRRSVLQTVDGWSEWCITEDAELGLKILADGHEAHYVPQSYGQGLMPDNFLDYKKQRFRWAYGSVLILRHHIRYFLRLDRSKLTSGQRYHFVAGWLPWMADGLSLMFNCVALFYSVLMVIFPYTFAPPEIMLSLLPISLFLFKFSKMLVLYRWRLQASLRQSLAAGVAGLAVSHTISRAMFAGLRTTSIGFFRTPKQASQHSFLRALTDAREEGLIGLALIIAGCAIAARDDAYLADTRLWIVLLVIQSLPYWSAVALSLVSAYRRLPARLMATRSALPLLAQLPTALSVRAR